MDITTLTIGVCFIAFPLFIVILAVVYFIQRRRKKNRKD